VGTKRKVEVGDLVICRYDFEYLYYPYPSNQPHSRGDPFYMGIVVRIRKNAVIYFDRAPIYEVLCTDGQKRCFTGWEIEMLRKAQSGAP